MKKLRAYDPNRGVKLGSWVGLISRNTTCNYSRNITKRLISSPLDEFTEQKNDAPNQLDQLLNKELYYRLRKIVSDFTAKDRWFTELYFGMKLDPLEISKIMSISPQTVHTKLLKIKNKLLAKVTKIEQRAQY